MSEPLADLLRAAEPAARLVPERLLRRVARRLSDPGAALWDVPHAHCAWASATLVREIAEPGDLTDAGLPDPVLLLPDALTRAGGGGPAALRAGWRLLFHAALDRALDAKALTEEQAKQRLEQFGPAVRAEVRAVLAEEDLIDEAADDRRAYREFAAHFLELFHFAPALLPGHFPALPPTDEVRTALTADVDDAALLTQTQPAGAVLRPGHADTALGEADDTLDKLARAEAAAEHGNHVRAAVLRSQAADQGATPADEVRAAAAADLANLVGRLRTALHLDDDEATALKSALAPLLPLTARGNFSPAARLLYDLQKICVDAERPPQSTDLVEWLYQGAKGPVVRPLPAAPPVLAARNLAAAYAKLGRLRLPDDALARWLRTQRHHAEARLNETTRPALDKVLTEIGLTPANAAEEVARDKLIAELLDGLAARGFLTISDVRDAVARNQLKLPDLSGPKEFFTGDPLIRANRFLARDLDGVYRRGEIYLRWLQRGGSLAFGTHTGRLATTYAILPFGGALMTLKFSEYLAEELSSLGRFVAKKFVTAAPTEPAAAPPDEDEPDALQPPADALSQVLNTPPTAPPHGGKHHIHLTTWPAVVLLGALFLAIIHVPAVRAAAWTGLRAVGRGLAAVFTLPAYLGRLPAVRWLFDSRALLLIRRHLLAPLALTLPWAWLNYRLGFTGPTYWYRVALGFIALSALCNLRPARLFFARIGESIARGWRLLGFGLFAAGIALIADLFRWALDRTERVLYAVDEWFRFRPGDNKLSLVVKCIFGLAWFAVSYVARFGVRLLIEPQVNPVKHFPVVTVSHKLLFPLVLSAEPKTVASPFGSVFVSLFGWGAERANAVAFAIVFGIPGIFGFFAWELLTNWRLYRANRSKSLRPSAIGSHGETLAGLLRPGFHSGTVPRLFRRLRRAESRSDPRGRRAAKAARLGLEHAEEALQRFAEREFLPLLAKSQRWAGRALTLAHAELATNRAALVFGEGLTIAFEEFDGKLRSRLEKADFVGELNEAQKDALADALAGLDRLAGVADQPEIAWEAWAAQWDADRAGKNPPRLLTPTTA